MHLLKLFLPRGRPIQPSVPGHMSGLEQFSDDVAMEIESLLSIVGPEFVEVGEADPSLIVLLAPLIEQGENHVRTRIHIVIPEGYPDQCPFKATISEVEGHELHMDARQALQAVIDEATGDGFQFMPSIYQFIVEATESLSPFNYQRGSLADERDRIIKQQEESANREARWRENAEEKKNEAHNGLRELFGEQYEEHGQLPGESWTREAYLKWWRSMDDQAQFPRVVDAISGTDGVTIAEIASHFESDASKALRVYRDIQAMDEKPSTLERTVAPYALSGRQFIFVDQLLQGLLTEKQAEDMHHEELREFISLQHLADSHDKITASYSVHQ